MPSRTTGIVEVVVPPRSPMIGLTLFPGMIRPGQLVLLAIRRLGKDSGLQPVTIAEGDALLYYGKWRAVETSGRQPGRAGGRLPGVGPPPGGAARAEGAACDRVC